MKLVAAALAALSLSLVVGCATENDGEGGGHLAGLRPAKPQPGDPKATVEGINPAIEKFLNGSLQADFRTPDDDYGDRFISADTIIPPFPINGLCEVCSDGVLVLKDRRVPGELNVIDGVGKFFCRIWIDDDGNFASTDCR